MGKKIIVIDDDCEFVDAVAQTLKAKGYEVNSAGNGKDGFRKICDEGADLILLDVMMDRKTEGFDIARQLKKENKTANIPIILITGIRKELNLPFGFETDEKWLPVKMVLEKPVKPQALLEAVEKSLS